MQQKSKSYKFILSLSSVCSNLVMVSPVFLACQCLSPPNSDCFQKRSIGQQVWLKPYKPRSAPQRKKDEKKQISE